MKKQANYWVSYLFLVLFLEGFLCLRMQKMIKMCFQKRHTCKMYFNKQLILILSYFLIQTILMFQMQGTYMILTRIRLLYCMNLNHKDMRFMTLIEILSQNIQKKQITNFIQIQIKDIIITAFWNIMKSRIKGL